MAPSKKKVVRRRALRLDQNTKTPLYLFVLTGKELLQIADISRVSRDDAGKLLGYQRPEVKRHITDIVEYLDSEEILFPNSIILALSTNVSFQRSRGPRIDDGLGAAGTIEIPWPGLKDKKPAWIVDGQQRALAIARSKRQDLAIPVNAFIADDVEIQRDQFIRVNSTKPLPRGLITELLPEVTATLPAKLAAKKIPSALCDLLARDDDSPFLGIIRRPSTPAAERRNTVITDTSIIKVLEESLASPSGALFPYRNMATGETDFDGVKALLYTYWNAVKEAFPEAWGKPPKQSRLMHGVGIRSVGRLMDRIMSTMDPSDARAPRWVKRELARVAPFCRWTSGEWEELGGMSWNELQNVPRHIRMLSNYLIRTYLREKTSK